MVANHYNGIMCVGHLNGTLSMVQPRDSDYKPVVTMFCHEKAPLKHVAVDPTGMYMITAAADHSCKVWDIRNTYQPVTSTCYLPQTLKSGDHVTSIAISQTGMLALSLKHCIAIYKHFTHIHSLFGKDLYLLHKLPSHTTVCDLSFCPYEDLLGVGHSRGFSSLMVPGSGSTSFDSKMPNPYFTDQQVKDYNVRTLLEKIPHEMICLDPSLIGTSGLKETQKGVLSGGQSGGQSGINVCSSTVEEKGSTTIQLSDELKQELNRVGLTTSMDMMKRKRSLFTSKDEYRQELFDKYTEMKNSIPQHWYEEGEDADALDRFASLKKRKLKYDEKKKMELRKQQQVTEEKDRVKQLMKQFMKHSEEQEEDEDDPQQENVSHEENDHHHHHHHHSLEKSSLKQEETTLNDDDDSDMIPLYPERNEEEINNDDDEEQQQPITVSNVDQQEDVEGEDQNDDYEEEDDDDDLIDDPVLLLIDDEDSIVDPFA